MHCDATPHVVITEKIKFFTGREIPRGAAGRGRASSLCDEKLAGVHLRFLPPKRETSVKSSATNPPSTPPESLWKAVGWNGILN